MRKIAILLSDKFATKFMQSADVFDSFKVVVMPLAIGTVTDDWGNTHLEAMLKKAKDEPYGIVAIFDGDTVYYRQPGVKSVSNGEKWIMLDDYIGLTQQTLQKE